MSDYLTAFDQEMGFTLTTDPEEIDARIKYYMGDQVAAGDLPQDVYNALSGLLTGPTRRAFGINMCRRFTAGLNALLNVDGVRPDDPADLEFIAAASTAQAESDRLTEAGQPVPPDLAGQLAAASTVSTAEEWVWRRCQAADWSVTWNRLQTLSAVAGVGYLVLDYDRNDEPIFYVNAPCRAKNGVGVEPGEVDDEGRLLSATKRYTVRRYVDTQTGMVVRWVDWLLSHVGIYRERPAVQIEEHKIRVIYEPGLIRRFVTPPNGLERPADPEKDGLDPETPWSFSRIPVIAFTSPVGNELDDILDLQRLLNHAVLSLAHLSLVQGFPVTWAIDAEMGASTAAVSTANATDGRRTKPTSGDTPQLVVSPGALLAVDSRDGQKADIKQIDAADLAQQMDAIKLYGELAAWINGYPPAWLPWNSTATPPSGEALKQMMRPLFDKAELYMEQHAPQLSATFDLLQEMGGRRVVSMAPVWREMSFADPQGAAAMASALQLIGADPETLLELFDLTPAQRERALVYIQEEDANRAERVAANLTDLMPEQTAEEVPSGATEPV
jgi:hypothetical protein